MQQVYKLLALFLLSVPVLVYGQGVEVVVQSYHTDEVEVIKFSPDGSKIATGGRDKSIRVWETRTSKLICTFSGYLFGIKKLEFSPDGKYLISDGDMRLLKLWNIVTGKEETFFVSTGMSRDFIHGIAFDNSGRYLATTNQQGDINLYDFTTRQLLKTLKGPEGRVDQFGFSPDGKKIYAIANATGGRVIDHETGKTELNITKPATADRVAYSSANMLYAYGYKDGNIEIKNAAHQVLKKFKTLPNPVSELDFSPLGNYIAAAYGMYNYFVFDTKTFEPQFKESRITFCAFAGNDSLAGIAYKNGQIKIFNTTANSVTEISSNYTLHTVMDINVGYCAHLYGDNSIRINRLGDGHEVKMLKGQVEDYPVSAWFTGEGEVGVQYSSGGAYSYLLHTLKQQPVKTGYFEKTGVVRTKQVADVIYDITPNNIIATSNHGGKTVFEFEKPVKTADISPDGKHVDALTDRNILIHAHLAKEATVKYTTGSYGILNLLVSSNGEFVYAVNGLKRLEKYKVAEKKKLYEVSDPSGITTIETGVGAKEFPLLETPDGNYILHVGENWNILVRNADGSIYRTLQGHSDHIHSLAFDAAGKRLVSASEDGTVIIWDWKGGQKVLTLVAANENWIGITPQNYYFNNKNGYRLVGFKVKDKAVPFEQFDLEFNRPDKVLATIGADQNRVNSYYLAYLKRLKKEGIKQATTSAEIENLPVVTIKDLQKLPLQTAQPTVDFIVKISREKVTHGRLAIWVNGVPENTKKEWAIPAVNEAEIKVKIALSSSTNYVKAVFVNDAGIESTAAGFEISYAPAKPVKPDLYVLCVGVSEYKNPRMNLQYAAKDSRDLVAQFKTAGGYGKITIDTLLNQKATRENILAYKTKLAKARPDDMVLVSFSGHGLLDDSMNFYFATYDIDFKQPAKRGLAYEEIEGMLAGITPRKRLLLMDACHSGEADKEGLEEVTETTTLSSGQKGDIKTYSYRSNEILEEAKEENAASPFDLMMEMFSNLNRGSGTIVISAAAGNSYALEADDWKNGVFTFCVLEGLKNQSADVNKDGAITVSELREYVCRNVETLTRGRQKPTSRSENTDTDWVVWK